MGFLNYTLWELNVVNILFQADTKLQIAKEVFTMLLKQKRDTKLGEDYWNERIKAVIKCIGVVSSQEYYNPHYTWIRYV